MEEVGTECELRGVSVAEDAHFLAEYALLCDMPDAPGHGTADPRASPLRPGLLGGDRNLPGFAAEKAASLAPPGASFRWL